MAGKSDQFFSSVGDGIKDLQNEGSGRGGFQGRKSIIGQARQNIFEFPVFVVNTLPLDFATATVSLLEQVYASFLQMAVSAKPLVSGEQIKKGRQFSHLKTDTNRYLEYTEDMSYVHDACHNTIVTESGLVYEYEMISYDDETARLFNEYLEHDSLSEFGHFIQEASLEAMDKELRDLLKKGDPNDEKRIKELKEIREIADKNVSRRSNRNKDDLAIAGEARAISKEMRDQRTEQRSITKDIHDQEADLEIRYPKIAAANEVKKIETMTAQMDALPENHPDRLILQNQIERAQLKLDQLESDYLDKDNKGLKLRNDIESGFNAEERAQAKHQLDMRTGNNKELRERMVKASEVLKDQDIQKLNTMKPLMMVVRLRRDEGGDSEPFEFTIGVKCRIRMVPADMMPEVAEYPLREMNKISRRVKWKAGELKFFKDILFKIPQRKQTAIDSRDPKRKWFRRLHELAHAKGDSASANFMTSQKLSMSSLFDMGNFDGGVIPNASIIVTKSVIDNVKAKTGIDLLRPSEAMEFCKELFLISFIVVDQDAESIKVLLPDLHGDFEVHSLASVNKQLASLDTAGVKTREVFKVLS